MSDSNPSAFHGSTAAASPFRAEEVQLFQAEDRTAATHIVGLMLSIFVLGVIGYSIVAMVCDGRI